MLRLTAEMSDQQIARLYGCSAPTVAKWHDFYGIPRSPRLGGTHKWRTDRDFFAEIDTPAKAYILGFLIADGHVVPGRKIQVSVKESDADLLRAISAEVGCDAPLATTISHYNGSRMARLTLYGRKLTDDLGKLGLDHDKSRTATYPQVPSELERHLVRGLWDGDGYIGARQIELIGTPALLEGVSGAIQRHTGCLLRRRLTGRDRKYHALLGSKRDAPVLHWMYSGATIALERKMKAASGSYWIQVPRA
jgi:hypothetical protein